MINGRINLHRQIINSAVWGLKPESFKIFVLLLLKVNYKQNVFVFNSEIVKLEPGQVITSVEKLTAEAGSGITIRQTRTALQQLQKLEILTIKTTNRYSLITIVNWVKYQSVPDITPNETPNKRQTNDKQTTNKRQQINKEIKEIKEIKEDNIKIAYADDVVLSPVEYEKLITEYGTEGTEQMIKILDNYKGASGKKYKSDYKAILTWVVKRFQEENEKKKQPNNKLSGKPSPEKQAVSIYASLMEDLKNEYPEEANQYNQK